MTSSLATTGAVARGAVQTRALFAPTGEVGSITRALVTAHIERAVRSLAFELVSSDQLVPMGAGDGLGQADAGGGGGEAGGGHETNIATTRAHVTSNRDVDGSPAFARVAS